jgi:DNA invertase Pin-like site-specific DNA recombinase
VLARPHRHALGLELARDRLEQQPIQTAPDQLAPEPDEGGTLRRRLVRCEAAEPTEAGAIVQRLCATRAEREGWTIAETFIDAALSGATTLRPGYQALLARLRLGGIDIVLAESLDRFSRDQEHIAGFYKLASFAGVRVVTLAEGEISELHIGLKGTMGALYLKDLAAKTRRGLEGRIRQGRGTGTVPYGYRIIRRLRPDGEPDRGLREIHPEQATIVRRIFADYAAGHSPRRIAQVLNAEGIPSPNGGVWTDSTIRGRPTRGEGILRNALYIGRLIWNRRHNRKDPTGGYRVRKDNPAEDLVVQEVPHLAILDTATWQRVQDRLIAEAAPRAAYAARPTRLGRFWECRRPRHLLTGKIVCGVCGRTLHRAGKDYLSCRLAGDHGCPNRSSVRYDRVEAQVVAALRSHLMQPDLLASFAAAFVEAWQEKTATAAGNPDQLQRELDTVDRRIANLVDALAEGIRAPDINRRLNDLQARRAELAAALATPLPQAPTIPPDMAAVYRAKLAHLTAALAGPNHTEAREAARTLIDKVIITPPTDPDDPPGIELLGNFPNLLQTAGLVTKTPKEAATATTVLDLMQRSVKKGPGARPLAGPGRARTYSFLPIPTPPRSPRCGCVAECLFPRSTPWRTSPRLRGYSPSNSARSTAAGAISPRPPAATIPARG